VRVVVASDVGLLKWQQTKFLSFCSVHEERQVLLAFTHSSNCGWTEHVSKSQAASPRSSRESFRPGLAVKPKVVLSEYKQVASKSTRFQPFSHEIDFADNDDDSRFRTGNGNTASSVYEEW